MIVFVRVFVEASMEVGSLTLDLFIIRFEMVLLLFSLGRAFGKQKFLKWWLFKCGQQLIARFLHQIILYFKVALWQISIVCVVVMRNLWITFLFFVH